MSSRPLLLASPLVPWDASPPQLSLVIPFRDESASLAALHAELAQVLDALPFTAELIFVDDESRDDGPEVVSRLAAEDARIRLLSLSPHAGQSAALEAGFRAARGELVATLDADLQNDPADLPMLLAALAEADCVCGVRIGRRDRLGTRIASHLANGIRQRVLGDRITDIGCSLRVMRREPLARIKLFRGGHRFLPVLLALEGARVVERPVRHRPRRHGRSKYGVWMRLRVVWADLLGVAWLSRRVARYEVKELSRRA
jgi:dolichol-phosphate mannosyltransferase